MSTLLALAVLTLAPSATQDAPTKLITDHGVELRADEDVFVLFAALNAAGYAEETERKGPPLRAPVFHAIRVDVRDALRKVRDKPSMEGVRKLFETNPGEIEDYLSAALAEGKADLSPAAKKIRPKLDGVFSKLREEAELVALFDKLAEDQRNHAKELKAKLEADFAAASKILGGDPLRGPANLVVVPNPLDGHGMVRVVDHGDVRFLVVGPGFPTARRAILEDALRAALAEPVKAAFGSARGFSRSWDGLKTSKRIRTQFTDGPNYLTEGLTAAVAHSVLAKRSRDTDEDFIDEQARKGMRWARASLKVLDSAESGAPLAEQLPKIVGKVSP